MPACPEAQAASAMNDPDAPEPEQALPGPAGEPDPPLLQVRRLPPKRTKLNRYLYEQTQQHQLLLEQQATGRRNMLFGGLWFSGGAIVTGVTYASAANSVGGGHAYVAIGALVFGAAQFCKGLAQSLR
jgi:hypothetical protein